MKLKTNSIITLDNQERYLVLNETTIDNKEYYLVMGIDENNNTIASKVAIFESEYTDSSTYVIKIEDKEKISNIMNELKKTIQK